MVRCLSLFGLMFFALGLVALTSVKGDAAQPALPEEPSAPPRPPVFNAPRYHVQFSLN
jgi:hypothetical protein